MVYPDLESLVPYVIPRSERLRGVASVHEKKRRSVRFDDIPCPSHAGYELGVALKRSRQIAVLIVDVRTLDSHVHLFGHFGPYDAHAPANAPKKIGDLLHCPDCR